jgi:CBS domain-containing membrane protein
MKVLDKPLASLTAADLMSREIVTIPQGMSLRGAARLLRRARVTGAPVVDATGCCIGVLSTSDFLKLAGLRHDENVSEPCVCCDWQVMDLHAVPEDAVTQYMTPDPVMVGADMPLAEVARCMLDAHIHRVIVVEDDRRPVGILSTTDVLAAVARRE